MDEDKINDQDFILEVKEITKHFGGVIALDKVSLHINKGEHVALVGDNGAGKSTLANIITGVLQPDSGSIWFEGREHIFTSPLEARLNGMETVFQDLALANDLGVVENIFLGRERYRLKLGPFSILNHSDMKKQARQVLEETGIKIQNLEVPIRNLSGGQRQGVAIARAASWGSKLIILDEPTAALGVQETKKVEEIIRKLKQQGISALMISHNLTQVFSLSDNIWVLRHGKMVGSRITKETEPNEIVSMITGAHSLYY